MKEVSEFEAKLLRILRCLMHQTSVEQSLSLFVQSTTRPRCLSRNCVELVQDGLSKGVTEWLARSGWMNGRYLQNDAVLEGTLWRRHAPQSLRLTFTRNSMELLIWLTSENFSEPVTHVTIDPESTTSGDLLLMLMSFSALRSTLGAPVLLKQPGFTSHGLIALLFPESVALMNDCGDPDIAFWFQTQHAWILEALQSRLAQQWCQTENSKRTSSNHDDVRAIGILQQSVLEQLFQAVEKTGRKDLAAFLLIAAGRLFQAVTENRWYDRVDLRHLKLSDRSAIHQAGLTFFRSMNRLQQWTQKAQSVSFYDEDYRASQLWKSEWERLGGDRICQQARRIIELVDPLRTTAAT